MDKIEFIRGIRVNNCFSYFLEKRKELHMWLCKLFAYFFYCLVVLMMRNEVFKMELDYFIYFVVLDKIYEWVFFFCWFDWDKSNIQILDVFVKVLQRFIFYLFFIYCISRIGWWKYFYKLGFHFFFFCLLKWKVDEFLRVCISS